MRPNDLIQLKFSITLTIHNHNLIQLLQYLYSRAHSTPNILSKNINMLVCNGKHAFRLNAFRPSICPQIGRYEYTSTLLPTLPAAVISMMKSTMQLCTNECNGERDTCALNTYRVHVAVLNHPSSMPLSNLSFSIFERAIFGTGDVCRRSGFHAKHNK